MPGEDGVEIHLGERRAAILDLGARHDWHSLDQRFRFFAAVCFDDADDNFASLPLLLPRRLQHGVGLAHAGRHPKENLQFATGSGSFFALHAREKFVGIRPFGLAHAAILRCCRGPAPIEAMDQADEEVEIVGGGR